MIERTDTVPERLDMDPIEVPHPADGTRSPEIEGDGTGHALPPVDDDAYPPDAVPLPTGDDR